MLVVVGTKFWCWISSFIYGQRQWPPSVLLLKGSWSPKHFRLCYCKLRCPRTRIFPVSEEVGHNASKSDVLPYRFMLMMFALNFGKYWNADFPVGEVNMYASHDVTNDVLQSSQSKVGPSLWSVSLHWFIYGIFSAVSYWRFVMLMMMVAVLFHFVTLCNKFILGQSLSHCLFSDFPGEVSGRSAVERVSPLLWKNRTKRRRASHPGEIYNEQGASEADIDSDSGYCSPKHNQATGVTQRTAENTAAPTVSRLLTISSRPNRLTVNFSICFW